MKKTRNRKIHLHRETLKNLSSNDIRQVQGGTTTNCPGDPTFGALCSIDACGKFPK